MSLVPLLRFDQSSQTSPMPSMLRDVAGVLAVGLEVVVPADHVVSAALKLSYLR